MFFYIILWSTVLAIVVLCLYLYILYDFDYWTRYGVACIAKPSFPFGNAWGIFRASQCSGMELFKWYKQIQGPFAGAYILNAPVLFVKDPEILRRILVKDFNYFCDRGMYIDEKKEPLSGHLFRLSGDRWRSVRSKLSPAFTIGKLKMMFDTLAETGKQWQETLENTTEHGSELNISDHSLRFISDAIASTIFGIQVNSFQNSRNDWINLVHEQLYQFNSVRYYIFLLTTFAPHVISCLKFSSIYKNTNEKMFQLVREVVQYRETNNVSRNDFMQLLIQLKNTGNVNKEDGDDYEISPASGDGITLNEMSAAAYSMFFAGIDTSASTIVFCMYELAKHAEYQARLQADIDTILAKYNGNITYDAIMEMSYLEQVINETLRMYPILPMSKRVSVKDYALPEYNFNIPKGTTLYWSIYGSHHNPEYFPEPEKFDPERFSTENKPHIKPYTYMPFGDGPRNCIGMESFRGTPGKRLAYLQTAFGIVQVLKCNSVSVCAKTIQHIDYKNWCLALNPSKPVILKLTKRLV